MGKRMLFNSLQFAVFLPVVFAIYWALPHKGRWPLLLAASYYFYMSWNVKYVVLIVFTTVISFFAALAMEKTDKRSRKKTILWMTLLACLGVLFVFKYFNFFAGSLTNLFGLVGIRLHPVTLRLLLPVGISFYTFQTLSYVIDVYRGDIRAEHNFGVYATFVSFFPQLVAGPIERTRNLLPQIKAEHRFDYHQATYGLKLMAWGFFKKLVIADFIAAYADKVFDNVYSYRGFVLILAAFFFTIQIYCDFSAYSDIARGTAKLLGIELMENFKSPYFSASIREFWSRWHISLSTWFRDYVYIPLGGNRVGKLRHDLNLLLTFLVSGLWHGANWTFVIWGGIHGAAQIAENRLGLRKKGETAPLLRMLRVLLVFVFSLCSWVFFRARNIREALYVFGHMFYGVDQPLTYLVKGLSAGKRLVTETDGSALIRFAFFLLVLAAYDYASLKTDVIEWIGRRPALVRHGVYIALILSVLFFHAMGEVAFVYFQF